MTTINTKETLLTFKGDKPLKVREDGNDVRDLEVGEAMANILLGQSSNPGLSYRLGKKFATEGSVCLSLEEGTFLKQLIEKTDQYTPLVSGQLLQILDPVYD